MRACSQATTSANRSVGQALTATLAMPPAKTAAHLPSESPSWVATARALAAISFETSRDGSAAGSGRPTRCSAKRCWFSTSPSALSEATVSPKAAAGSTPRSIRSEAAKRGSTSAPPRTTLRTFPKWEATASSSQVRLRVGARIRSGASAASSPRRAVSSLAHSEGLCLNGFSRATFHSSAFGNRGARVS